MANYDFSGAYHAPDDYRISNIATTGGFTTATLSISHEEYLRFKEQWARVSLPPCRGSKAATGYFLPQGRML